VLRLKVTVLDGTTTVESFNIDLSADIVLNAEPDVRQVPRGAALGPAIQASSGDSKDL
jgi:hypothetical protein